MQSTPNTTATLVPEALPKGAYGIEDRPRPQVVPITFVGGTGRSGTHIVAQLLGRSAKLASIPVECRFHVEDRGFPGLLAGSVGKEEFVERLRGFWWKGFQTGRRRGMFRFMPRERLEVAARTFEERFDAEPEAACRQLFLDLLWPRAVERGASGIVEQSCDSIAAAPTLVRLFPEARFVHVVRDGRDASASRVAQARWLAYPRTRRQGLEWWEARIRDIDAGAQAIPEGHFLEVALEELLTKPRRPTVARLSHFSGVPMGHRMRRFFWGRMDAEAANAERWKRGLSSRRQEQIEERYVQILDSLEADGIGCAPLLRQTYDRRKQPSPG